MLKNPEMLKDKPETVKARIFEYNGGQYGRNGEFIAIVKPEYFKNGNVKRQSFKIVETLETIKKGYGYGNCNHALQLAEILEIL